MQKKIQLPKDQVVEPDEARAQIDGEDDVEGHGVTTLDPEGFSPRLPSTGGEAIPRLPSTGGDLTDDTDEGPAGR